MPATLIGNDALTYCRTEGLTVVGHNLDLEIGSGETVHVAILARDQKGHFLAVSPIDLDGSPGIGIIDLNDASARFVRANPAALAERAKHAN